MNISYFEPLSRAFNRMKVALFKPFDISKWFVMGFNAFLAGLLDGHGGGGNSSSRGGFNNIHLSDIVEAPQHGWEWLIDHPGWFMLIAFLLVLGFMLFVILTWLSSRGKFMFLDNVVTNRAEVKKPWAQYKTQGNSLFLWRLIFGFIIIALFVVLVINFFYQAADIYRDSFSDSFPVLLLVKTILIGLFLMIIIGYIANFLDSFVIPIMYKHNLTINQAWSRFLHLFGQYPLYFLLYGIITFILAIIAFIIVIIAGLFTCCIGFIFLIIPYINAVVLLPISFTFRTYSLEFLAQFGEEYTLIPKEESI